jgi:hypothetical protein
MSWSVSMIGKSAAVVAALEATSAKLEGQSKLEFDAALPSLIALVSENFARGEGVPEPVLRLDAGGSGYAKDGEQVSRSLRMKLESCYTTLV